MSTQTISSGLTLTIPTEGTQGSYADFVTFVTALSSHDHTASGDGTAIGTSAIADNAVTGAKINLAWDEYLQADSATSGKIDIVKVGTGDKLVLGATVTAITVDAITFNNASTARTALGVAIGSDVQAYDADLAAIAALSPSNDDLLLRSGGAWIASSGLAVRQALNLVIGTDVQQWDQNLEDIKDITFAATGDVASYVGGSLVKQTVAEQLVNLFGSSGSMNPSAHSNYDPAVDTPRDTLDATLATLQETGEFVVTMLYRLNQAGVYP